MEYKLSGTHSANDKIIKKLLIFGIYYPTGNMTAVQVISKIKEAENTIKNSFNSLEKQMPFYKFQTFIFPSKGEGPVKMELIYEGEPCEFIPIHEDVIDASINFSGYNIEDEFSDQFSDQFAKTYNSLFKRYNDA